LFIPIHFFKIGIWQKAFGEASYQVNDRDVVIEVGWADIDQGLERVLQNGHSPPIAIPRRYKPRDFVNL
jgi:hypothetical protein